MYTKSREFTFKEIRVSRWSQLLGAGTAVMTNKHGVIPKATHHRFSPKTPAISLTRFNEDMLKLKFATSSSPHHPHEFREVDHAVTVTVNLQHQLSDCFGSEGTFDFFRL